VHVLLEKLIKQNKKHYDTVQEIISIFNMRQFLLLILPVILNGPYGCDLDAVLALLLIFFS